MEKPMPGAPLLPCGSGNKGGVRNCPISHVEVEHTIIWPRASWVGGHTTTCHQRLHRSDIRPRGFWSRTRRFRSWRTLTVSARACHQPLAQITCSRTKFASGDETSRRTEERNAPRCAAGRCSVCLSAVPRPCSRRTGPEVDSAGLKVSCRC
jgi:hypothetical protein